jgi:uncharacterized protein YqjF (DUF2071 family)
MHLETCFLRAQWGNLAIMNFEIDRRALLPLVPEGTELDPWRGSTLVSLVGFEFLDARLWDLPVPWHRKFVEVNLRFYVRRSTPQGWRRGVVFVKELVARRAVAWTARWFYGENFARAEIRHRIVASSGPQPAVRSARYDWTYRGKPFRIAIVTDDAFHLPLPASEAEFVVEHYWAYSGGSGKPTREYRVEHPPWRICVANRAQISGDVASLYGQPFVEALSGRPTSAMLVEGSAVSVFRGAMLPSASPSPDPDESNSTRYTGRTASA